MNPGRRSGRRRARAAPARWRGQVSLGLKLTVSIIMLAALSGGVIGWLLVGQTAKGYREGHQREARALARALSVNIGMHADDPQRALILADRLVRDVSTLRAIRVYLAGEGGPILWISTQPGEAGQDPADPEQLRPVATRQGFQSVETVLGEDVLETVEPLRSEGNVVGTVAVYTSLVQLQQQIVRQGVLLVAAVAIVALVAVIIAGFLVHRLVLRPLRRLSGAATRVAAGDLSVRLPEGDLPPSRDTMSRVARELDHMVRAVDLRTRQQAAVAELGRLIVEGADLDTLLDEATALLARHLDVGYASALELSADGSTLDLRAGKGWRENLELPVPADSGSLAGYTLEVMEPVIVEDLMDDRRYTPPRWLVGQGIRSGLSVPVPGRARPWGVLSAFTTEPNRFARDDVVYLTALASTLGSAIESRGAQDSLEAAEAKYRVLVERVPAITYIAEFGLDGRWWFVSPQIESVLGYTVEEWMADRGLWERSLHPDDQPAALEQEAVALATGQPLSSEYRVFAKDGREVWIRDEAVVATGDLGAPVLQGVMYDVTKQREAERASQEARAQYQTLVEQVPAVVYVDAVDEASTAVYMSPQVENLTGYTVEEWLADPDLWKRSLHPDDADRVLALSRETNRTGDPFRSEYRLRHRGGEYRWVRDEARLVPSSDGSVGSWQGIFYDITDRRAAEEGLRRSFEHERDVADRLRNIDEMKNAFLAAVSHELRTPLSSVLGYALTLERPDLDVSDEERLDMTHRLAVNARKLERLLTDLLDLDRLARGVLEPRRSPTHMGELVDRILGETDLRGRHVETNVAPLTAEIDAPKVERIVENLVANAIKHTSADTRVSLEVRRRDDGIEIRVEDDGRGIPDELKGLMFEPFRQGPGDRAHVAGTGIGLSLVARFAELHGGRAWVQDRDGGGASFRVTLPCATADPGSSTASSAV
ncbi:MAG TPA: PAS domain-containing protein [Actinomycetota bacterium]|nr:PAS domain-containing protein [Actinomycetota bacterium]